MGAIDVIDAVNHARERLLGLAEIVNALQEVGFAADKAFVVIGNEVEDIAKLMGDLSADVEVMHSPRKH